MDTAKIDCLQSANPALRAVFDNIDLSISRRSYSRLRERGSWRFDRTTAELADSMLDFERAWQVYLISGNGREVFLTSHMLVADVGGFRATVREKLDHFEQLESEVHRRLLSDIETLQWHSRDLRQQCSALSSGIENEDCALADDVDLVKSTREKIHEVFIIIATAMADIEDRITVTLWRAHGLYPQAGFLESQAHG